MNTALATRQKVWYRAQGVDPPFRYATLVFPAAPLDHIQQRGGEMERKREKKTTDRKNKKNILLTRVQICPWFFLLLIIRVLSRSFSRALILKRKRIISHANITSSDVFALDTIFITIVILVFRYQAPGRPRRPSELSIPILSKAYKLCDNFCFQRGTMKVLHKCWLYFYSRDVHKVWQSDMAKTCIFLKYIYIWIR